MSITLQRNGKFVELYEFSNEEVVKYLSAKLNTKAVRFRVISKPKFGNSIMVKYDDVYFMIYAYRTCIEFSFEGIYREKMSSVIDVITEWNRFSKTQPTFYVEIEEGRGSDNYSNTVIFENGFISCGEYKENFKNYEVKITKFQCTKDNKKNQRKNKAKG